MRKTAIALLVLAACTKPPAAPEPVTVTEPVTAPVAAPVAAPVTETATVAVPKKIPRRAPSIAQLAELQPRVTFRRSAELVWQEATRKLPLFAFDALQTHAKATARVAFQNGSELSLDEKTLVIIGRPPPGKPALHAPDRAVVRAGTLKTQTRSELWLLTSAALFKMKAASGEEARANVTLEEGKELKIELVRGEAKLVRAVSGKTSRSMEEIPIEPGKPFTLPAPNASADFGREAALASWPDDRGSPAAASSPVPAEAPLGAPIDLFIASPANNADVAAHEVELAGRATGPGGKVLVNGQAVALDGAQAFSVRLPLDKGANSILIQLVRPDGTSVYRRWTVIRRN